MRVVVPACPRRGLPVQNGLCKAEGVATTEDLKARGFTSCRVTAITLNIEHPDPGQLGPFCRLAVEDGGPNLPGVYAWAVDGDVMYVGKANNLRAIVHGSRIGRPYNDYTYVPASKAQQVYSPRVRINGLLNEALCNGSQATWWWLETSSVDAADDLERHLRAEWRPRWNRT
jgi:hypothetical protein